MIMTKAKTQKKAHSTSPKGKHIKKPARIHFLDELRGFAILCMIFFHAFYSIGNFFDMQCGLYLVEFFNPAEPYFAGLFILISGIACNLSHSNLERGVKLAFISLAVTLVTYFAVGYEFMISFGILHMLSACMLIYGLANKYMKLIPSWLGIALNALLFVFTFRITRGQLGLPFLFSIELPASWYSTKFLFAFGLPDSGFYSSDYFPLFPWMFLFMAGTYLGRIGIKRKFPKFMHKNHVPFLSIIGRHSLLIYLAHQPLIFGICYLCRWVGSWFN